MLEAGNRIPFITYWKGTIQPQVSDALVCQMDLLASLAKLVGGTVGKTDSVDLLDVLLGKSDKGRESLVLEATSRTSLRKGEWLMIPPYKGPEVNKFVNIELGNSKEFQLYNIVKDPGELNNLAKSNPEKLKEMLTAFEKIRGKDYSKTKQLELK